MKALQKGGEPQGSLLTAAEVLKTLGDPTLRHVSLGTLRRFLDDKGFSLDAVRRLANLGLFGGLLTELVLRRPGELAPVVDGYAEALPHVDPDALASYRGTHAQNRRVDLALANSGLRNPQQFLGEGAATYFASTFGVPTDVARVPIAVIGAGAAGTVVAFALRQLGFGRVKVLEKAKPLGIWSFPNVSGLSRNNPRQLQFYDRILQAAPGPGEEVRLFLENLGVATTAATVTEIVPGNLRHEVRYAGGKSERFPIVINTVGLGKPKPLSDPERMVTSATAGQAGSRWQKQLRADEVRGRRLAFIGLGNSTAEMLLQVHDLMDRGVPVDYRVLTHYPEEAVYNPNSTVHVDGRPYRVFRDVSLPNLVDFQGDLARSRRDYYRALLGGKILHGVRRWERSGADLLYYRDPRGQPEAVPVDQVMTLTGYANSAEVFGSLGCAYDARERCALFDYDGEFSSSCVADPRRRLRRGYYGFGSVLETPHNRNAIVIPGMLHRIGDLLFGVVMRATEYAARRH